MNALIGQTSRFDIANRTISGISCIGRFTAAAVNTQLLANDSLIVALYIIDRMIIIVSYRIVLV